MLAEVGRGAFGRVYRAWDPALQMEVALKLIRVDTREPDFAESVFHEARLLVKVRHPNVVTVLGARRVGPDVGIWMEFINGPTLGDAVERDGPMGAGRGGGCRHCRVRRAGGGARRRPAASRHQGAQRHARSERAHRADGFRCGRRAGGQQPHGEMAGTPLYMAPEVLKGAGASVASDIYSVGVLLFHLATGEYPVTGASIYELEAAHESGTRVRARRSPARSAGGRSSRRSTARCRRTRRRGSAGQSSSGTRCRRRRRASPRPWLFRRRRRCWSAGRGSPASRWPAPCWR